MAGKSPKFTHPAQVFTSGSRFHFSWLPAGLRSRRGFAARASGFRPCLGADPV